MLCDLCNQPAKNLCSGCKVVGYCCGTCQKARWPTHKGECAAMKQGWVREVEMIPARDGVPSYPKCSHKPNETCDGTLCNMPPRLGLEKMFGGRTPVSRPMSGSKDEVIDKFIDDIRKERSTSGPTVLIDISHHHVFTFLSLINLLPSKPTWWTKTSTNQTYERMLCNPDRWLVGLPDWLKEALDHQMETSTGWWDPNKAEDYSGVEMVYNDHEAICGVRILFCDKYIPRNK